MWYFILIGGMLLFAIIISLVRSANEKEEMRAAISSKTDFSADKKIADDGALYHFAVDQQRQEVYCYAKSKEVRFKFKDIVEVEIQVNGDTTVSNKSASLGGALAGGVLAGGLGAVVGGSAMGKTTSKKEISSINVHILLRNCNVDSFDIECLSTFRSNIDTNHPWYKEAYSKAQGMFDALKLAMDAVKTEITQPQIVVQQKSNIEELKELAELKQQGLITEEEFATMKAKIINK